VSVTSEESNQIQNRDVHEIKHCKKAREEPVKTQMNHKKYLDKTAKVKLLVNGDKVLVLLSTALDKLLFQWKGPAVITERRGLVNYRVTFESGEEKTFHINVLKNYNEREDSDEAPANMPVVNSEQFTNNEETNNDAEGEEDVLGVIVESDDEFKLTQNSVGSGGTDIVAAMGVVVDSDSESDDYQERIENSSARCYSIA